MIKKYYFTLSNLVLITLGIYFGVNGFYKTIAAKLEGIPVATAVSPQFTPQDRTVSRPLSYYKSITDRNLFGTKGQPEKKQEKTDIDTTTLQETNLKLTLWGTVAEKDGSIGYAVIEDKKERKQGLYREGMTIQNATIKRILRKEVVLSVNGIDERLIMEDWKTGKGSARSSRSSKRNSGSSQRDSKVSLKRSQIDDALDNVNELMKQVKIRPHFKDGKPDGLMLSNIKSKSIFRKMGLRNGDVVMGIDGQDIETVDDALKFYENLKSSENVILQIKRRGKMKNIDYNIQ